MKPNLPLTDFLCKIADDDLILGHRNSEWTGLGPVMEEDIAFSSMAQDKIGHALSVYRILHEHFGWPESDKTAFLRKAEDFRCCHFTELPIGEYDFSLVRHFLFDHADALRYEMLAASSFAPVSALSRKIRGELKYHTLHADTWLNQLGRANDESRSRLQSAFDLAFPFALGIFEPGEHDPLLAEEKIFGGEALLKERWLEKVSPLLSGAGLSMPDPAKVVPVFGGRSGRHTEHLQPLLDEMSEVLRSDLSASW